MPPSKKGLAPNSIPSPNFHKGRVIWELAIEPRIFLSLGFDDVLSSWLNTKLLSQLNLLATSHEARTEVVRAVKLYDLLFFNNMTSLPEIAELMARVGVLHFKYVTNMPYIEILHLKTFALES
jgi:hypothetical protein